MAMASLATTTTNDTRWSMSSLKTALPCIFSSSPPTPRSVQFPVAALQRRHFNLSHSTHHRKSNPQPLRSFNGLSPLTHLLSISSPDCNGFDDNFVIVEGMGRVYAMRHGRRVPKLNRPPDQRRALLRGLTTQLLKYGRIKTTRARASAMRKYVDKMITLAKDGSLHKRRQALGFLYEKQIVHALFAEVPERYGERNGGYTRIIRTLPRRGDNAPMVYIELGFFKCICKSTYVDMLFDQVCIVMPVFFFICDPGSSISSLFSRCTCPLISTLLSSLVYISMECWQSYMAHLMAIFANALASVAMLIGWDLRQAEHMTGSSVLLLNFVIKSTLGFTRCKGR